MKERDESLRKLRTHLQHMNVIVQSRRAVLVLRIGKKAAKRVRRKRVESLHSVSIYRCIARERERVRAEIIEFTGVIFPYDFIVVRSVFNPTSRRYVVVKLR